MAIELHIQIDLNREDNNVAVRLNKDNAVLQDVNMLIAELERIKLQLLDTEFEDTIEFEQCE